MNNTTRKNPTPAITTDILYDAEGVVTGVEYTFASGNVSTIALADLSREMLLQAAAHGLKQKVADAAAIGRDIDTGLSATAADKEDAATEVIERITSDATWNKVREAGEGTGGSNSLLLQALCTITGKPKEAIAELLAAKTKEEKALLRLSPKVAAAILKVQQARKPVSDDVLGEFM